MRNSVLRRKDRRTETKVQVLSCASQLKSTKISLFQCLASGFTFSFNVLMMVEAANSGCLSLEWIPDEMRREESGNHINISYKSIFTHFAVFSPPVNFSQAMLQISRISFFWKNRMNVVPWISNNGYDLNLIHCTESHNWIWKGSCSFHFDFRINLFRSFRELVNG